MKKTFKVVAILLLVLVTSTFVFAQTSRTYYGTAGTLRDEADNFMDVRYFNEVDFSNFWAWTNISSSYANLGFAKKFDELYLGAYYAGSLWNSIDNSESSGSIVDVNNSAVLSNEFDLLFGFSGMAIKLDTYFNTNNTSTEDTTTVTDTHASNYYFGLTWGGLSVPAEKFNLRPWAKVGLNFIDKYGYSKTTIEALGITTTTTSHDKSGNYNYLTVILGSDFEWGDKEALFSVAGFEYLFGSRLGLNGALTTVETNVDGVSTTDTTNYVGKSYIKNTITPYYRFEYKASDNLKFGGKATVKVDMTTSSTGYSYSDTPVSTEVTLTKITNVNSEIDFGMQYKLKQNFAMNVGYMAVLPSFEHEKEINGLTSVTTVTTNTNSFSSYLRTGFVWDINENCALDASMSIGTTPSFLSSILDGNLTLGFKYKK